MRFVRAESTAGIAEHISEYGATGSGGKSLSNVVEMGQFHMGEVNIPSDSTDSYIRNSFLFYVGNMKALLLLVYNKQDGIVPFGQSIEMFTTLRRLQRSCWILQYDGEQYIIMNDSGCMIDYNVRQQQFFNHYLKGYPVHMVPIKRHIKVKGNFGPDNPILKNIGRKGDML